MTDASQKKDWADIDWLLTHFWAKSANRLRQVGALPIRAGDRVLDVGCGPGIYTNYLSDLVGPNGRVVGIDRLNGSVDYAAQLLSQRGCKHALAVAAKLEEHFKDIQEYDVVIFMNSLGYFQDPLDVIQRIASVLKPGARVIVKDYDLESIFLSPINRRLLCELIQGAWDGNSLNNPLAFNNFLGRQVPFLATAFPFVSRDNVVWTQLMIHPFIDVQRRYISENIVSLIEQARGYCSDDILRYFDIEFVQDGGRFFDRPTALFTENEYVSIMTR